VQKVLTVLFWVLTIIIYPMLISMYVTLPLFVGFAGLMMVIGIEEERRAYTLFALIYMLNLEINLSLPMFIMPISVMVFYIFIKDKLAIIKLCKICVRVVSVILINAIYFFILANYDFITDQSSVNYDSLLLSSVLFDIIAVVLI